MRVPFWSCRRGSGKEKRPGAGARGGDATRPDRDWGNRADPFTYAGRPLSRDLQLP